MIHVSMSFTFKTLDSFEYFNLSQVCHVTFKLIFRGKQHCQEFWIFVS